MTVALPLLIFGYDQCCQPCAVFPWIWACYFLVLRVFWRHAACLFLGLFWLKFACFLGLFFADYCYADCFFFKFCGTFDVSIYCLRHIGCVFMKICSIWACFFRFPSLLFIKFHINFLADFLFCWIFLPTHVGLVFQLNYLFLACFLNLLACFCKITRHHWLLSN